MAETYKGLTIKIGGDTSELTRALKASDKAISSTQKQLRQLERAANLSDAQGGAKLISERLDVMGDKAQALTLKVRTMRETIDKLDSNGSLKELAANTNNAALKAEQAKQKYNGLIAEVKQIKNEAAALSSSTTDPFKSLGNSVEKTKAKITELFTSAGKSAEQAAAHVQKYENAVKQLNSAKAASTLAKEVSEYKDLKIQMAAASTEAHALGTQMAQLAATNPATTQTQEFRELATRLKTTDTAAGELRVRLSSLNEAFRLDPTNIGVAEAKLRTLQEMIETNSRKMHDLNSQMNLLRADGFDKIANETKDLSVQLNKATENLAQLETKMRELQASSAFDAQSAEAKQLAASVNAARERVEQLSSAQKFNNLNAAFQNTAAQTNNLSNQLEAAKSKTNGFHSVLQNVGWSLTSTITPAVVMFGAKAITEASEVDTAYRNMRKTVQGTETQFESLRQAALDYSKTHYTSADEILEIEALGGQLGVATSKLESFATVVSNLDIATDLDAETAATQLGQLSGILNDMTQDDFSKYGDALTRLGNNNATLESKISDVMLRISSMGTISGFTTPQLLAWATAVASTGQESEAAGTAISKTMSDIEAAVGAGGEQLQGFASVAGMSATDFATAWKNDPSNAMKSFIEGLKNVEASGGSADATLGELGITSVRQKQAILGLTQTIDGLNDNITMSNDAWNGVDDVWGDAGDAAREADRKAEGFSGSIQMLENTFQAFCVEVGGTVAPVVQGLADVFAGLTSAFAALPSSAQNTLVAMTAVAAGIGPVSIAMTTVSNAFNEFKQHATNTKVFQTLTNGFSGVELRAKFGAVAMTAFKTALAGIGIGAAIAVITLLIEQFQAYSEKVATATQAIDGMRDAQATAQAAVEATGTAYHATTQEVIDSANKTISAQSELATKLKDSFSELGTNESLVNNYAATIKELAGNCDGSASKLGTLKTAIDGYNEITGSSIKITDSLSGAINTSTADLDKNTASWKANAEAEAFQEAYTETVKQRVKNEMELKSVEDELSATQQGLGVYLGDFAVVADEAGVTTHELANQQQQLQSQIDTCSESEAYYLGKLNEAQATLNTLNGTTEQTINWTAAYAGALGKTTDEFSTMVTETNNAINSNTMLGQLFSATGLTAEEFTYAITVCGTSVDDLGERMNSLATTTQDAFNKIELAAETTPDQMLENLNYNIEVTRNWANNIEELYRMAGSGAGQEFVAMLAEKGPEYASTIEALKNGGSEKLQEIVAKWQEAGTASATGAAQSLNASSGTLAAAAANAKAQWQQAGQSTQEEGASSVQPYNTGRSIELANQGPQWQNQAFTNKQDMLNAMATTVQEGENSVSQLGYGITNGLNNTAVTAVSIGSQTGANYAGGVNSTTGQAASAADNVGGASEQEINDMKATFWNIGASAGSNYATGIWSKMNEAAQAGNDIAWSSSTGLGNYIDDAWQRGAQVGSQYSSGIWSKMNEAYSAASDLSWSASEGFNAFSGQSMTWGAHLAENFANGLSSKKDAVKNAAKAVANAAHDELGFSVPKSGVWSGSERGGWRSGTHLVQNFTQGIQDEIPTLSRTVARLANTAAASLHTGEYQGNLSTAVSTARSASTPKVNVNVDTPQTSGENITINLNGATLNDDSQMQSVALEFMQELLRVNKMRKAGA